VSTAAGIAFALSWQLGIALLVIWLVVALAFRISSLASLAAALASPPLGFYFLGYWPETWALVPITLLMFWRHRANIRKLIAGEERRIGEKSG
jgi:glycerol-3-phosphate acyltransferase PlsY